MPAEHPPDFTIRAALPGEAPTLNQLAIRSKASWGYEDDYMALVRQDEFISEATIATGSAWALVDDTAILGFVTLIPTEHPDTVELDSIFIDPVAIGSGHGRRLWDHALAETRRRGYRRLVLVADPNAAGFYLRMGATRTGARPSSSWPGRVLPEFEIAL